MKRKHWKMVAVVWAMIIVLAGCGSQETESTQNNSAETIQETGTENVDNSEDTVKEKNEEKESMNSKEDRSQESEAVETEVPKEEFIADRSDAFALVAGMNVGWNLGNTFDAHGAGNSLSTEWYWGNPKTTQKMIDAIAEKGFNTIRIPVTWAEHVGTAPEYKINDEWINRVQEVVDYAVNNNMYVILNTHHEPDFWMTAAPEKKDAVAAQLAAIWKQIAEHFMDYDEKLLFEGMNENRVKGSSNEWNGGTPEERIVINELNQVFVDTVRATGGNNENRFLIISTYGNNGGYQALKELEIPEDNRIIVALHLYTPYFFTYDPAEGGYDTWDGSHKADIVNQAKLIDKELLKKGVPVIITEFGAVNKNNEAEVVKWLEDYMNAMNKYGIKCVWWDNGNFAASGEKFAIFDRRNQIWYTEKVVDKLMELAVTGNQIYPAQ